MRYSRLHSVNLFTSVFLAIYLAGSFGLSMLLSSLHLSWQLTNLLYSPSLYLFAFGLPALWYFHRHHAPGESPASFFGFRHLPLRSLLLVCAAALLVQPVMMLISSISQLVFRNITSESMLQLAQMPLPLFLLTSAVFPAFFEELLCRGILLKGYRQTPLWYALLLPAVFFGLLHLNFQQAIYAIAGGIFFALLVTITDSLWSSILAHLLINGLQSLLSWMLLQSGAYAMAAELPEAAELMSSQQMILAQLLLPLSLTALTLPPLIFCLLALYKAHRAQRQPLMASSTIPTLTTDKEGSAFGGLTARPLPSHWHKGAWVMYTILGFLLLYCSINEIFLALF